MCEYHRWWWEGVWTSSNWCSGLVGWVFWTLKHLSCNGNMASEEAGQHGRMKRRKRERGEREKVKWGGMRKKVAGAGGGCRWDEVTASSPCQEWPVLSPSAKTNWIPSQLQTTDPEEQSFIQRRYSRFFTVSSQCRELSPTRTLKWPRRSRVQITCNTSSAYLVQHVLLRAAWYEGTAQLSSLTELKLHLFELYFVGWIIKPMKEGRKPEYPEKTPGDELQKACERSQGRSTRQLHQQRGQISASATAKGELSLNHS